MAARGRKTVAQEQHIRELIETFSLRNMGPSEIRNALASSQNSEPISLSLSQVNRYLAQIRRDRASRIDPAVREQELADLLAHTKDVIGVAAASSARYRDSAHGVGYLNTELKAITIAAKLQGLDVAVAPGRGGPPVQDAHPLDDLSPAEQSAQFARWAEIAKEAAV
ncbi:MAG: hypothetical protein ABSC46_02665 [Candidatus Limnocylindrales bacterium]